jgi:hypothetical protein
MYKMAAFALGTLAVNALILFAIVSGTLYLMEVLILLVLFELITGLVLTYIDGWRQAGWGILAGFGLSCLIGLAVCSRFL